MGKASQVILIVEDNRHQQLLYRYLLAAGIERHAIRIERSPSGSGSAENWVRRQFLKEVRVYRSRQAQTKLIIVLDADIRTVQERLRQLDQVLQENNEPQLNLNTEQVARLIPKRNIETWILCLNDADVNEEEDYKRGQNDWSPLMRSGAERLYQWTRPNVELPRSCVNSLELGIEELRRIDN